MEGCNHCFGLIDVKVNKQLLKDEAVIECIETYSCLKCGQDSKYRSVSYIHPSEVSEFENEMLADYDEFCMGNQELLVAIYNRIKEKHPDTTDDNMYKYIRASLYNMETKTVALERYKKRVLRLNLDPEFCDWNKNSVIHYGDKI